MLRYIIGRVYFKAAGKALAIFILLSLFSNCGELDMLFPSNGSYRVNASVNGSPLDDCSMIRSDDTIRPYFATSVENDPDLTGLLMYIQNPQGEIIGEKVLYTVKSFEQAPPPFPLPEKMEMGSYSMVFEAIGEKETLYRRESAIFYLGDIEFSLKDLSMYLPRISDTQLIPPGTTIMMESRLNFDSRLEPYVIWYNGKNVISEGLISEGAGTIFWKAPEQAGFYSLKVEVFPFQLGQNFTGIIREIALPVSSKAAPVSRGYFFEDGQEYAARSPLADGTIFPELERMAAVTDEETIPIPPKRPELLRWYQFEGNLFDTAARFNNGSSLVPTGGNVSLWTAVGQSYGLSTGPEDAYLLSPVTFFDNTQQEGGGIFLFHVSSLAEGGIFSVFFPWQTFPADGVTMDILRKGNAIVLQLHSEETTVEVPAYLTAVESDAFIPAAVEFYIRPYCLEAKLSVGENHFLHSAAGNIMLPGSLAGEGRIVLGGGTVNSRENTGPESPVSAESDTDNTEVIVSAAAETDAPRPANTVWNEFAVLYSSLPIQPEEIAKAAPPEIK